jgi:uncharacterized protein (DUF433 family)/DNA-binding transcriptional MerR regulator
MNTAPILAFTAPQVLKLTGLTQRMLSYWHETGVFEATFVDSRPRRPYRRIYSFSDVVSLRTLAILRRDHKVPLDHLRQTGQHLLQYSEKPWTQKFWVQGGRVLFKDPGTGVLRDRYGQTSFIDVGKIWDDVVAETKDWNKRSPADHGKVVKHRHVQRNRWVIKGTRIPISAVWSFHDAGYDTAGILRQYPNLSAKDVKAALAHYREHNQRAA